MPYIVYSLALNTPVCRWDGRLSDLTLRAGEVAIPCAAGADPNDPAWAAEAADYETAYALTNARTLALDRIDRLAADARAKYITTGAGQDLTYQLKADEAVTYIAAGRPAATAGWPMLTAEAEGTGDTVSALADTVLQMRQQWVPIAASIEAARIGGKKAVSAAADAVEIAAALDHAVQQLAAA